jgi:hypothetical protein
MAILRDLLAPSVVTGMITRVFGGSDTLQRFFGMEIGSSQSQPVSGRQYSYDIFDHTRSIALGSRPGTAPAVIAPFPVAKQNQTFPRAYEKMSLDYEKLHNLRELGSNAGVRDRIGAKYLEEQMKQMKRRQNAFREMQLVGLFQQGVIYYQYQEPNELIPVLSLGGNPGDTYDFLIPAGNKSQLNMLGSGNILDVAWDNVASRIDTHVFNINAAFQNLVGRQLEHIWLTSVMWLHVLQNTAVRNLAGSANQPMASFTVVSEQNTDGQQTAHFTARFNWCPWIQWHVYDGTIDINGTVTKCLSDTKAVFHVGTDGGWIKGVEGSEMRKINPIALAEEVFGFDSWIREWDEPARVELHSLQNFLVEVNTPKGIAIGTVDF